MLSGSARLVNAVNCPMAPIHPTSLPFRRVSVAHGEGQCCILSDISEESSWEYAREWLRGSSRVELCATNHRDGPRRRRHFGGTILVI